MVKSQICASEGARGALHAALSMRGSGGGTMRVRKRLVGALSPPRVRAAAPLRRASQPFFTCLKFCGELLNRI